jgi:hypothetical protein
MENEREDYIIRLVMTMHREDHTDVGEGFFGCAGVVFFPDAGVESADFLLDFPS